MNNRAIALDFKNTLKKKHTKKHAAKNSYKCKYMHL